MLSWFTIFLLLIAVAIYYIGRRLIRTSRLPKAWNLAAWSGLVLIFVLPIAMMIFMRRSRSELPLLSWTAYTALGLLSFAFFTLLIRDVLFLFAWIGRKTAALISRNDPPSDPSRRQFLLQSTNLGILGVSAVATSYGIYEARKTPGIVRMDIPISRLPAAFDGFRIVQICDIHAGLTVDRAWIERVVQTVEELHPDLIAFVGDMVDGSVPALESTVAPFGELKAPYGKFFTTGNHEYYSGANDWIRHAGRLGFDVLMNEHRDVMKDGQSIVLAGVTDYTAGQFIKDQASDPRKALEGTANDDVRILMAHQPRTLYELGGIPTDLVLNGHTHGGQFIPWNLLATFGQPFIKGLHRWNDGHVYVSKGTGYWGPPVRLGARSEITEFTLVREGKA